jgi:hypothetical protein
MSYPRASAILTSVFLLFGIFVVAMIGIEIVMGGLTARRAQGASSKAFYAAESGVEQALNLYKLYGSNILNDSYCHLGTPVTLSLLSASTPFCPGDPANYNLTGILPLESQPKYWVKATNYSGAQVVSLNARGNHANTSRELYLNFCLPDCSSKLSGDDDGCGGLCN